MAQFAKKHRPKKTAHKRKRGKRNEKNPIAKTRTEDGKYPI